MAAAAILTDETLRSQQEYGKAEFPFSCCLDHLTQYGSRCVEWHWHNEFEFSFVKEGTVLCHAGANCVRLYEGDGLFINSRTIHRFETAERGVLVNCIFSPEFIAEKSSAIYLKYVHPFLVSDFECKPYARQAAQNEEMLVLLQDVYVAAFSNCFGKELQIRNLVSTLWLRFVEGTLKDLRKSSRSRNKTVQARLHEMMTYIHANYHRRLTLMEIALAANISKSEALRCFHIGLETTPVTYLNEYRLARAAERLLATSDSVAAVSDSSGFESTGYFCRKFREKYGVSPNGFRKQEGAE